MDCYLDLTPTFAFAFALYLGWKHWVVRFGLFLALLFALREMVSGMFLMWIRWDWCGWVHSPLFLHFPRQVSSGSKERMTNMLLPSCLCCSFVCVGTLGLLFLFPGEGKWGE